MDRISGYIECEIGGMQRPIKFGMGAWEMIADERGKNMADIFKGLSEFAFVAWIAYAGCKFAYLAGYSEIEPPKNVHIVMDWLNDAPPEVFSELGKCFASSKIPGASMQEIVKKIQEQAGDDVEEKKKKPLRK